MDSEWIVRVNSEWIVSDSEWTVSGQCVLPEEVVNVAGGQLGHLALCWNGGEWRQGLRVNELGFDPPIIIAEYQASRRLRTEWPAVQRATTYIL